MAVLNASSRSVHATAQLREILTTMSARLVEPVPFIIEVPDRQMTAATIAADAALVHALRASLDAIAHAARSNGFR